MMAETRGAIAAVCLLAGAVISQMVPGAPTNVRVLTAQPASFDGRYQVRAYGALCDGATDDAAAIRRAIRAAQPAGILVLPPQRCVIKSTIVLGDDTGQQRTTFLSIEGAGPGSSELVWMGPEDRPAVSMVRNKRFTLRGLTIRNGTGVRGTSTGLLMTGYGGIGTETLGGYVEQVSVVGFHVGIQAGETQGNLAAASDTQYHTLGLEGNDVGMRIVEGNSLNHFISNLHCNENGVCLDQVSGSVSVESGATFHNGIDFRLGAAVLFSVRNVRAEMGVGEVFVDVVNAYAVRVESCYLTDSNDPSTIAVRIASPRHVTIADSLFLSRILVNGSVGGGLHLRNNELAGDTASPVFFGSSSGAVQAIFHGNSNNSGTSGRFSRYPDVSGPVSR